MPKDKTVARAPGGTLSAELYAMICDELCLSHANEPEALRAALKNCRLVSHAFYNIATTPLFRDLIVSFDNLPAWAGQYDPGSPDSEDSDIRYGWEWNESDDDLEDYDYVGSSDATSDSDVNSEFSDDQEGHSQSEVSADSGRSPSVAPSDSTSSDNITSIQGAELEEEEQQGPKSFERFHRFLLASPHLCGHIQRLTLVRNGGVGYNHATDSRGDIPESLLLDICTLLPNLRDLCLRDLLTRCKDPRGPLSDNLLSLEILRLDMSERRVEESMLLPLRVVCELKHLVIGPINNFIGTSAELCPTTLVVPALSSTLFVDTLHFHNCTLVYKFLKPLDRQTHILKHTRHLRSEYYDSSDRNVVRRFLVRHQASMESLSLDLFPQREWDLPTQTEPASVFVGYAVKEAAPFMRRLKHLTLTDDFYPTWGRSTEQLQHVVAMSLLPCWMYVHAFLSRLEESKHLETVTIASYSLLRGWNWPLPPAELSTEKGVVIPPEVYDLIDKICELRFPALKQFTLLSGSTADDTPATTNQRSVEYVRQVQRVFTKLHERGVLVIAECLDQSQNPDDVPPRADPPYKVLS